MYNKCVTWALRHFTSEGGYVTGATSQAEIRTRYIYSRRALHGPQPLGRVQCRATIYRPSISGCRAPGDTPAPVC